MSTLRHLNIPDNDKGNAMLKDVFAAETNPIIIFLWESNDFFYENTMEKKLEILLSADIDLNPLMFVWEGKKKTDVFELTAEDVLRILSLYQ